MIGAKMKDFDQPVCVTNAAGLWLLLEMLISSEMRGPHLVTASFEDHRSLVDVEICAISGVHICSHHNIMLQLKLVDAIKEAGN